MAFVLMITREGRVDAGLGRQIGRRRCDRLDARLFVIGDDGHRVGPPLRLGRGFLQDLDFAIDAQNLRHLRLEVGVALFQIVAHLVRLDFLLAEYLAHRALNQTSQTFVPRRRPMLARMAGQQARRPQLMGIAVVLGLVARQRHQPRFGLRRDRGILARSRSVIEGRQRTIGQRPLDTALNRLMMDPELSAHRAKARIVPIRQQHLGSRHAARGLGPRTRKRRQCCNVFIRHRQFKRLTT